MTHENLKKQLSALANGYVADALRNDVRTDSGPVVVTFWGGPFDNNLVIPCDDIEQALATVKKFEIAITREEFSVSLNVMTVLSVEMHKDRKAVGVEHE